MSAEHFLEELRRFIAGRSRHDEFISANDTHFKASKKTIDMAWKDIINEPQVHSYLSDKRINWSFIIVLSPWMGGFCERLVGTTKMALKKITGRMPLTQTQLQTIITDFEEVVNSRPLVYVADDLENQIINQMHFLSLNTENGTPTLSNKIKKIQTTKMKKLRQHKKYLKHGKGSHAPRTFLEIMERELFIKSFRT